MRARTAILFAVALFATACGGSGDGDATDGDSLEGELITQGDGVSLADSEIVSTTTTESTASSAGGAGEGEGEGDPSNGDGEEAGLGGAPEDTIPQNEEDAGSPDNLFSAMRIFNDCLSDEGQSFIGIPDPALEADDPVNDPGYLDALQKCAALSNIQEAFASFQQASDNLDPDEIEERNRGLVIWADCLRGRGWIIDDLVPDDRGLLNPSPDGLTPPDGQSILGSDDMQECASTAQAEVEAEDAAEDSGDEGS